MLGAEAPLLGLGYQRPGVRAEDQWHDGNPCRVGAQGMLNRRKAATRKRVVKVGKAKRIALRVKPNARRKLIRRP